MFSTQLGQNMGQKVYCVLWIYVKLTADGFIHKDEVIKSLNISTMSFARYIKCLRLFLNRYQPKMKLHYRRRENVYWLKKEA